MKKIPDDRKITGITMPGTHDSACLNIDIAFISQTQKLSVTGQLEAGVRYFDFRFKYDKSRLIANHSICHCRKKYGFWNDVLTADDIVSECIDFLKRNPSEAILFQLKEAASQSGDMLYSTFYDKFVAQQPDMWFAENRIPTMGETRGKIIILRVVSADKERFTDDNCGIDFTAYPYVGSYNIDDWRRGELKKLDGTVYGYSFVQDSYKTEGKEKWATVTRFLESGLDRDEFNICYTSCTRLVVPRFNYRRINPRLLSYTFKSSYCGIIAMDFIDEACCRKIVDINFA